MVPPSSQDEALSRYSVSGEVPREVLEVAKPGSPALQANFLPSRLEGLWYCGQGDELLSPHICALIPPPSLTGGITGKFRDSSVPQSYHL